MEMVMEMVMALDYDDRKRCFHMFGTSIHPHLDR